MWGLWGSYPFFTLVSVTLTATVGKIISLSQGPIEPDANCFLELYLVITGLQERYRKTHEGSNKFISVDRAYLLLFMYETYIQTHKA